MMDVKQSTMDGQSQDRTTMMLSSIDLLSGFLDMDTHKQKIVCSLVPSLN
jgi:hypothetical protein